MSSTAISLSETAAWKGKKLLVTDEAAISKLRRKALSASTSKSMQSCAARWAGEKLIGDDSEDPFAPAPLGTSAHEVLEDLFELPAHMRTLAQAKKILLAKADAKWVVEPGASDQIISAVNLAKAQWIEEVQLAYGGIFQLEDPAEVKVYSREMNMAGLVIEGVPFSGFIDRVEEFTTEDGKAGLRPVDYKSGKVLSTYYGDDHGDQLRLYAKALEVKTGKFPVAAGVYYTKFAKSRDIDLSASAMAKTLKTFKLSWKRHNNYHDSGEFPTKVSALCGWCPLVNSCVAAKEQGKTVSDKIDADRIPTAEQLGIPVLRPGAAPAPGEIAAEAEPDVETAWGTALTMAFPEDPDEPGEELPEDFAPDAKAVRESFASAHISEDGENPTTSLTTIPEEEDMAVKEDKVWVDTVDGELNPNSYAAIGVFGTVELAIETLHNAGQGLSGAKVDAMKFCFHKIITDAQFHWTGSRDPSEGANARMRGALRTALLTLPVPFGKSGDDWALWMRKITKRVQSITTASLDLFEEEIPDEPWAALAVEVDDAFADDEPKLRAA